MSLLDKLITAFLALVFAFTALDKGLHFQGFVNALNTFRIFPIPLGSTLAPLVIAAEMAIAVGLMVRRWRRIASLQAALLLGLFTVALAVNYQMGGREVCGCWFSLSMLPGSLHFAFNCILIALSLLVWQASKPNPPGASGARIGGLPSGSP